MASGTAAAGFRPPRCLRPPGPFETGADAESDFAVGGSPSRGMFGIFT